MLPRVEWVMLIRGVISFFLTLLCFSCYYSYFCCFWMYLCSAGHTTLGWLFTFLNRSIEVRHFFFVGLRFADRATERAVKWSTNWQRHIDRYYTHSVTDPTDTVTEQNSAVDVCYSHCCDVHTNKHTACRVRLANNILNEIVIRCECFGSLSSWFLSIVSMLIVRDQLICSLRERRNNLISFFPPLMYYRQIYCCVLSICFLPEVVLLMFCVCIRTQNA